MLVGVFVCLFSFLLFPILTITATASDFLYAEVSWVI